MNIQAPEKSPESRSRKGYKSHTMKSPKVQFQGTGQYRGMVKVKGKAESPVRLDSKMVRKAVNKGKA